MMNHFTFKEYNKFLDYLSDYDIYTVKSYIEFQPKKEFIILRHDVDRSIINAIKMADLEYKKNIKSSYYFRFPYTFDVEIISKLENMGHEVGYHYETLSKCNGDHEKAIDLFQNELEVFNKHFKIKTVSMHGSPLSKYNNLDLWNEYNIKKYGLLGDAVNDVLGDEIFYITDTGRNWNNSNNIRDIGNYKSINIKQKSIIHLVNYLRNNEISKIYFNIHPERWGYNYSNWIKGYCRDLVFNTGKKIISIFRR